ncbi:hypothetical protein A8990_104121 [Paenibacillus taihuensis]|uniref:Uncharacterized protein n=1 Tax=Paenibacillus taihuensis TaxID=1156355 RepID=A0A3D9SCI1_9BACL|nr:hypothetical protein [Paenibacillus taihuensis]REE91613.1 hypothetical protein A8990_104121 [Paenibacillus taihuensis]
MIPAVPNVSIADLIVQQAEYRYTPPSSPVLEILIKNPDNPIVRTDCSVQINKAIDTSQNALVYQKQGDKMQHANMTLPPGKVMKLTFHQVPTLRQGEYIVDIQLSSPFANEQHRVSLNFASNAAPSHAKAKQSSLDIDKWVMPVLIFLVMLFMVGKKKMHTNNQRRRS